MVTPSQTLTHGFNPRPREGAISAISSAYDDQEVSIRAPVKGRLVGIFTKGYLIRFQSAPP